jgi:hypothetical protein
MVPTLSGLDLKTVLENDPTMVTTGLCLQFIRDLERPIYCNK